MARILVADDSPMLRLLVRGALASAGHADVIEAEDGDAALDRCHAAGPDVAVLDVSMPGLDGFAVCRAIRADPALARMGVVILTAHVDDATRDTTERLARDAGADRLLGKPVSPAVLIEAVEALLARRGV